MRVRGASGPLRVTVHRQLKGNAGALRNAGAVDVGLGEAMRVNESPKERIISENQFLKYVSHSFFRGFQITRQTL